MNFVVRQAWPPALIYLFNTLYKEKLPQSRAMTCEGSVRDAVRAGIARVSHAATITPVLSAIKAHGRISTGTYER